MCAGEQKWDHLVTNEFALLFHLKTDEPSCEDFELLGRISLKDHCTLNMQTKNKKNLSEDFVWKLQSQLDTFFSKKLSCCCVALLIINE